MINTSHITLDIFYTNSIVCAISHAYVCRDNTFVNIPLISVPTCVIYPISYLKQLIIYYII